LKHVGYRYSTDGETMSCIRYGTPIRQFPLSMGLRNVLTKIMEIHHCIFLRCSGPDTSLSMIMRQFFSEASSPGHRLRRHWRSFSEI
jgi:hypothetical protein